MKSLWESDNSILLQSVVSPHPVSLGHQACIRLQDLVQPIPMQAILKFKALRNHIKFVLGVTSEMLRPLLHHVFGY